MAAVVALGLGVARLRRSMSSADALQRQLAEVRQWIRASGSKSRPQVEALRSIFPGQGELEVHQVVQGAVSFTVHLESIPCNLSVSFSFPDDYPEKQAAIVNVKCRGNLARKLHDKLDVAARDAALKSLGQESAFQVVQTVKDMAWELCDAGQPPEPEMASASAAPDDPQPRRLERKLFWFHHIKSSRKRKCIVDWGKELDVGGYCKPGFPGVLIIEGEDVKVAEYVKRVRHLRWQAMNLRAMEDEQVRNEQSLDSLRRLPKGVEELDENAMSKLGALCREANLEHMFLAALKIGNR